MKLLLTSAGITNSSIQAALVDLLGKPIAECNALCIPTAIYPFRGGPQGAYRFLNGTAPSPMCELGWKSLGILELTALPSIAKENWVPGVEEADVLLVWGGDPIYLCRWLRESGLADLLASMAKPPVYVGVSAGSIAVTTWIGETYTGSHFPKGEGIQTEVVVIKMPERDITVNFAVTQGTGLVDFSLLPHAGHERCPENGFMYGELWASKLQAPLYMLDDATAIKVVDGVVEVISEGRWELVIA